MPRSPYRHSPSYDKSKRDYRQFENNSQQRYYPTGQVRKKIHKNNDYNQRPRDDSKQKSRRRHHHDQRPNRKTDNYDHRPVIRIQQKKQSIQNKTTQPQSQIKIHFRFKPIRVKLNPRAQQELKQKLKSHISQKIGPVQHFERSIDSYPGFLILELGFRYDSDAFEYFKGMFAQIDITIEKQRVNTSAQPTKVFKLLISQIQQKKPVQDKKKKSKHESRQKSRSYQSRDKKQKSKHKKKRSYSQSRSKSSRSSTPSRNSRRSKDSYKQKGRHNRKDYYKNDYKQDYKNYKKQDKRQDRKQSYNDRRNQRQQNRARGQQDIQRQQGQKQVVASVSKSQAQIKQQQIKQQKTLFFFGVHYSVNSKDMDNLFRYHEQGPFIHKQLIWRRMKDSISEFLQGKFEKKHAQRLLQLSDKIQVKGHPFVILDSQSMQGQKLLQKIAQYQINIQFPQSIQPYHLLKGMKECGRVIQIVSINKLSQQGRGQYYNVTFNSKQVCSKLKAIKKTSKEIIIEEVNSDNALNIYRPNFKTELMTVDYFSEPRDNKSDRSSPSSDRDRSYDRRGDYHYEKNRDRN